MKLLIAGRDAPLLTMDEDRVVFQVPWEIEPDQPSRLEVPDDSLFEQGLSTNPSWGLPKFYFLTEPGYPEYSVPVAAHEDFRTLVTRQNPARRGEIIHLYFTGLGRVSPPIATGEITPAEPLRYLETPFACRYNVATSYQPIELLFVGLAPGFIGVNQVDMRVPEAAASPEFRFECVSTQRVGWNTGYATLPVAP